jgi:hypothetical protein
MAKEYLKGKRAAAKVSGSYAYPTNDDGWALWDNAGLRCISEYYTATADHAGYTAASGTVAVLPIGVVPKGSKLIGFDVLIGAVASATADRVMVAKSDGSGGFTAVSTIGSFTAANEFAGRLIATSQEVLEEDTELFLVPYKNGTLDSAGTMKATQKVSCSVSYATVKST